MRAQDFLTDNVPADLITGFVVCRAHAVHEHDAADFILRLYRERNKDGPTACSWPLVLVVLCGLCVGCVWVFGLLCRPASCACLLRLSARQL